MKKNSLTHADVTAACFCMLVFFFSAAPMRAESTFGDIIGVVKDPGQGVGPGTQVVLTNTDDRTQHVTTTDADGAFHFVSLKPGHYELVISVTGFAEFKITSAQLDARQTLRLMWRSNWPPRRKPSKSAETPDR